MKLGEMVRVVGLPGDLEDNELDTKRIFELCLGKVFPIAGFDKGFVELHVGEVVGEPAYIHMIWIAPEFLESVENKA